LTKAIFVLRAAAQRDLNAYADYFEAQAGKDLAVRFVDSARASFAALGDSPNSGSPVVSHSAKLAELRKWRIAGFPSYLIFYRPELGRVRIFRIIHGAQDWWQTLDIDREP
jgi:plasmid stabilization system protein ParE